MLVRYRCPVVGRVRLPFAFDVPAGLIRYDFETGEHGELKAIGASVSVSDKSMWPIVRRSDTPGVALDLALSSPFFELVRQQLRAVEGMLSLFGVEALDIDNADENWIPESEEEKKELQLFGIKRQRHTLPVEQWPVTTFDLIVRACLSALQAQEIETVLSFFRRGRNDVLEERYLEAVYDFLFMIESWYAGGKFKTAQVEREYLGNQELQATITACLSDPTLLNNVQADSRIYGAYQKDYAGKSAEEVTRHIIGLRGFVHHHSKGSRNSWHPDEHFRFGADAYFLQLVCFKVAFSLVEPLMFAEAQTNRSKVLHVDFLRTRYDPGAAKEGDERA